jgi:hypothetical protein
VVEPLGLSYERRKRKGRTKARRIARLEMGPWKRYYLDGWCGIYRFDPQESKLGGEEDD